MQWNFWNGGMQVRCMWYSHINLIQKKITLKCLKYSKGFCRNRCWLHHVARGGVPAAPKYGTKKRKRVSKEWTKRKSSRLILFWWRKPQRICRFSELLEKDDRNLIIFPARVIEKRRSPPFKGGNTVIAIAPPKGDVQ